MNELDGVPDIKFKDDLKSIYNLKYLDVKFKPVAAIDEEQSSFIPGQEVFQLTDDLIEKYVDGQSSELSKDDIMLGLKTLRNE